MRAGGSLEGRRLWRGAPPCAAGYLESATQRLGAVRVKLESPALAARPAPALSDVPVIAPHQAADRGGGSAETSSMLGSTASASWESAATAERRATRYGPSFCATGGRQ